MRRGFGKELSEFRRRRGVRSGLEVEMFMESRGSRKCKVI